MSKKSNKLTKREKQILIRELLDFSRNRILEALILKFIFSPSKFSRVKFVPTLFFGLNWDKNK